MVWQPPRRGSRSGGPRNPGKVGAVRGAPGAAVADPWGGRARGISLRGRGRYRCRMADRESRAGARYADPAILDYTASVHAPHDEALARAFRAPEAEGMPAIQVAPSEGKTLALLLRLAGARKVVEVGTLAGYSAIWMARALPPGGRLWSLEADPHHAQVARANLAAAGLADRVEVVEGDAVSRLADLEAEGPFCAVFVDADKGRYDLYGRWAAQHLRVGGLLIGDNAYFFGNLLDEANPSAAAMRRFHEEMAARFESVCLSTPDGMAVGIKTKEIVSAP